MHRLKSRPQFQAALAGKTLARTTHFALHCCVLGQADLVLKNAASVSLFPECGVWLGAMVPKRWAKRAVTRNAIKRQIYHVSAEFESSFSESAHVVRLRTAFDRKQFVSASSETLKSAVREELKQLFTRAQTSFVPRLSACDVELAAR